MEVPLHLVGCAVAVERERNAAVLPVLVRECEPGADRSLGANDAVASVEVVVRLVHVHRAALALGGAVVPGGVKTRCGDRTLTV